MDPISIAAGVFSFLAASIKTGLVLKEFHDNVAFADAKVQGLITEVESFTQVLRLMNDTLEQENIQSSLRATGHIGNHLTNLATSIEDGQQTLSQLQETLERVNKSVSLLDGTRKHLRLRGAADEISVYQRQIRSYRETLQLTLQTIILWNQVSFRQSTDMIIPTLMPNLDEIHQEIRRIALDINSQIAGLQNAIEAKPSDLNLNSLQNLRNCVKSAASIVSSASSTLSVDQSDRVSVTYQSDFGDCFPPEPVETMRRWISSNTVYEYEEEMGTASSISGPQDPFAKGLERTDSGRESDQSDSDGELEAEIIQSLLRRGKDKLAAEEFEAAERHFRNCLSRIPSNGSTVSLHRLLGSKSEIMALLLTTYRQQEKWDEAHSLLTEKIALESRNSSKNSHGVLADTLVLVEVLFKKSAFAEALLYGRRALKSYRRMGPDGIKGVQSSLGLLCQVCKASGNHDQEDAYSAILSDILQQQPRVPELVTSSTDQNIVGLGISLKPPLPEKPLSLKSLSIKNARSQDAMRSNNSWIPSSPSTSTTISDRTYRRDSVLSAGSLDPASPNTEYSSPASKSQEWLSGVEDPLSPRRLESSVMLPPLDKSVVARNVPMDAKLDDESRLIHSTHENISNPFTKESFHEDKVIVLSDSIERIPEVVVSEKIADTGTDTTKDSISVKMHEDNTVSVDQPLVETLPSPQLPAHEALENNEKSDQAAASDPEPIQSHVDDIPDPETKFESATHVDVIPKSPSLQQPQSDITKGVTEVGAKPTNYQAPTVENQKDESEDTQQIEKASEPLLEVQSITPKKPPTEPLPLPPPSPPKMVNYHNDLDVDQPIPVDRSAPRKATKQLLFNARDVSIHHMDSMYLEGAAIDYFRAGKGNPPKPVEPVRPAPRVPIPVSDYELLEWVGTLSDVPPISKPDESMNGLMVPSLEAPPQGAPPKSNLAVDHFKTLWKSKSAVDLVESGYIELPGETRERRKSTVDLSSSTLIAGSPPKHVETKPVVDDAIDWKAWYAPKPPKALKEVFSVVDGEIDWTAWYNSSNYVDGLVKETSAHTVPTQQPQAKTVPPVNAFGLPVLGPENQARLNTLIEMGYDLVKALSVLKRCNWDIERAANELANEVTEETVSLPNVETPQVFVTGEDMNNDLSPTKPFSRPVSFQTLTQLQSSALSAHMHRPSLSSLTGDRPESSPAAGNSSHKKSVSFDSAFPNNHGRISDENQRDESSALSEASRGLQYQRPRNPLGASLGFQFPAKDMANDLTATFSQQTLAPPEEQVVANRQITLDQLSSRTSPTSPTLPSITFSDIVNGHAPIRRKIVICGDVYCGKSSLVSMFTQGILPKEYHSSEFEIARVQQTSGDKLVELVLWDTGGDLNYAAFREKECYLGAHLVMICFAIDSPDSLDNAQELFVAEMKNSHKAVRYMLVGLKKDLRYDSETTQSLVRFGQHAVTPGEGEVAALKMGANVYMECSAKTGEGVPEIFATAASLALLPSEKLKKMRSFRDMFGKK